jgi:serine/threonine-protein kinase
VRLSTFGGLRITADPGAPPLGAAAARPRPLALLAVLAAAGPAGVSRDRLCALFWPESDGEHARNALSQLLFAIRRDIDPRAVTAVGATLALDARVLASDVAEFEAALAAGAPERAAALHVGPFLNGVHLRDAPEFERWVDAERARVADRLQHALRGLAGAAAARGDHSGAAGWWRRLSTLDPTDARSALGLMNALAAAGDRAGALQHARIYEAAVRAELDAPPDRAIVALAARLRTPAAGVDASDRAGDAAPAQDGASVALPAAPSPAPSPSSPARVGVPATSPGGELLEQAVVTRPRRLLLSSVGVAGALVAGIALVFGLSAPPRPTTDAVDGETTAAGAISVAPFRVAGADSSLAYLRDGMADLLATALAGGSRGLPVTDPATALPAWRAAAGSPDADLSRRDAAAVARRLGAAHVVLGAIVGGTGGLVVTASVVEVATGTTAATAKAAGGADSLPALVERLAVELLAGLTGEREDSRGALAAAPLAAVRAYLDGRAAFRRADYDEALRLQERAVAADSTFALAALELCRVAGWVGDDAARHRGYVLAWPRRDQLGAAHRAYVEAVAGPRYPVASSRAEWLAAWARAAAAAPEQPDGWFELGDLAFHSPWLGGDGRGGHRRARAYFRRALERAPDFAPALQHLVQAAAADGDTAAVRAVGERALRAGRRGDLDGFLRWRVALALGDGAALARARATIDSLSEASLVSVALTSQFDGVAIADGRLAVDALLRRAVTDEERARALLGVHALAVNRGDRAAAAHAIAALQTLAVPRAGGARLALLDAIHAGGDSAAAAGAAAGLARAGAQPRAGADVGDQWVHDQCAVGQWHVARMARTPAELVARALRAVARDPAERHAQEAAVCALLMDASLSVGAGGGDARTLLDSLDGALASGPDAASVIWDVTLLGAARAFDRAGEPGRALATLRRRGEFYRWPHYLAAQRREEGRLALAVGDSAGARCALAHYLVLRGGEGGDEDADGRDARRAYERLTPNPPPETWGACVRP